MLTMLRQSECVFQHYSPFAALAIHYYNKKEKTNFELRGVERVNKLVGRYDQLYITFQVTEKDASDSDVAGATKTFQAKVIDDTCGYLSGSEKPEIMIDICRLKPSGVGGGSSKGCESTVSGSSKQGKESDDFDVVCIPNHVASGGDSVSCHYTPYATLAIMFYSQDNREKWEFKSIEMVDKKSTEYDELAITFQATNKDAIDAASATKTFEAKVSVDDFGLLPISDGKGRLCRSCKPRIIFDNCMLKPITNEVSGSPNNCSSQE